MSEPSAPPGTGHVHVAVELDGAGRHPAAWRLPGARPAELFGPAYWTDLAVLAESAGLDFVALGHSFVPPSLCEERVVRGRLDAVAVAARVAPLTSTIGLVPTATVTHTEPFHLSKAIATLDLVSSGRAGWQPGLSRTQDEALLFGRKDAAAADELWREAAEAVEVVVRLWDSWEDGAVIRDAATGRYLDRDRLHYVDFAGEFFAVKGPSITPRPPQGHPLVVVRADDPWALPVAGRWADVVRIAAPDAPAAARTAGRVRDAVAAAGRDREAVSVLWDVEVLLADTAAEAVALLARLDDWDGGSSEPAGGTAQVVDTAAALAELIESACGPVGNGSAERGPDGVTLVPLAMPSGLERIAGELVPLLVARGRRAPDAFRGTLRERFGLARPANYFAEVSR